MKTKNDRIAVDTSPALRKWYGFWVFLAAFFFVASLIALARV